MVCVNSKRPHMTIRTVSPSGTVPAAGDNAIPRSGGLFEPAVSTPPYLSISVRLQMQHFLLDATLSMDTPCVTAVWGRSGCGKTTFLRAIAGLETPTKGHIMVNGKKWYAPRRYHSVPPHKRGVGFVFQEADLFPHLSVKRNLLYGFKRARGKDIRFTWNLVVELLDLRTLLERSPATLSGGQKQRVAIGRALLSQPELLLLDEPVSALDSTSRVRMLQLLQSIKNTCNLPMLYVTHQVDEVARLADRVCIMEDGHIVDEGPKIVMLRKIYRKVAAEGSSSFTSPNPAHFHNGCDCPYELMFKPRIEPDEYV